MWDDLKRQWEAGSMLTRLIFANVGVFTVIMTLRLLNVRCVGQRIQVFYTWKADAMYRPWSVITHMFVHVDIWHMVINMAWLYDKPHVMSTRRTAFAQHLHGGWTRGICAVRLLQLGSGVPKHVSYGERARRPSWLQRPPPTRTPTCACFCSVRCR